MARLPAVVEVEELPEPDRLDGFPHPRETRNLYGFEAAEARFAAAFASGRMHHAWLLCGPRGTGKATFAYRAARHVLAAPAARDAFGQSLDVAPDNRAARLVATLSHPDLLVIRRPWDPKAKRLRTEIVVEEVRRLRSFLTLSREPDQWRVVIVDPADDLNVSAANAILKSLEEPPARTVFFLISSSMGQLLPTIRSRCRVLSIRGLHRDAFRRAVAQALTASGEEIAASVPAPGEWPLLETLSGGSVQQALSLHAAKGLDLYNRLAGHIGALPGAEWGKIHALADELASPAAEARFELFHGLLLGLLARMVRQASAPIGEGEAIVEEARLSARLRGQGTLAAWAQLWETLVAEKADADALNLDRKALILGAFERIAALMPAGR